jgi:carboxymethylenebutenolidase
MTETIQLKAADGFELPAYVARPARTARATVVVLQEIFGVNSHIRAVADGYARQGYLAVAPELFHRVRSGVELGYTAADVEQGRQLKTAAEALPAPGVLADVAAAIAYGASQAGGKVGVVGYCWGGLVVWRGACTLPGLSAAVAYYGGGMTAGDEPARQPRCPVMCHFGEQDHAIPIDGVHAFAKAQPAVEVHVYPAQHGFNCDQRASFDAAAAALAQQRTQAFFARHLA